jgi:Ca2+-binding RTX toxin-like protein
MATYTGTTGNDTYAGTTANDTINGNAGNDTLNGAAGNDTITGGAGSDIMNGGVGNDTYIFATGFGSDTINENDATANNLDIIQFSTGITPAGVAVTKSGNNLILTVSATDKITVTNFFAAAANQIEQVKFADGTIWSIQNLIDKAMTGTAAADTLTGSANADTMYGLAGNDTITGAAGNDTITGGTGNDIIDGGVGNDTFIFAKGDGQDTINENDATAGNLDTIQFAAGIAVADVLVSVSGNNLILSINGSTDKITVTNFFAAAANQIEQVKFADGTAWDLATIIAKAFTGTAGNDTITGTVGNDTLTGLGGNDTLNGAAGNDTIYGGTGNDIIDGGAGNDIIDGGAGDDVLTATGGSTAGNDTYIFGKGYGSDTISENDATAGNADIIKFAAGVAASDISVTRDVNNLYLTIKSTGDKLTVTGFFTAAANQIEQVVFTDDAATIWSAADLTSKANTPTEGDDTLYGTAGSDTFSALGGHDTVYGGAGNDTLYGDAGNDTLYGEAGDDILDGGSGDDSLQGGLGNDTYKFGKGSGWDIISENDATGTADIIQFTAGVLPADIAVTRDLNNLYLTIKATGDKLTVTNYFVAAANQVEQIKFADAPATVWTVATINALFPTVGTAADNFITATTAADTLNGAAGNDTIYGQGGNDTIDGGAGNDTLYGGVGNDTYKFGKGSGNDVIIENDATAGNIDKITVGAGILPTDITVSRNMSDLFLSIKSTGEMVTVKDYFVAAANQVEQVVFANGTIWTATTISALLPLTGTAGADLILGTGGADIIVASGRDTIYAGAGNDTITGTLGGGDIFAGDGNDTIIINGNNYDNGYIYGGKGNDTFIYAIGDKHVDISDFDTTAGNVDTIQFKTGILPANVSFERAGDDLRMMLILDSGTPDNHNSYDQVHVRNFFSDSAYTIEKFVFADGTTWTSDQVMGMLASKQFIYSEEPGTFGTTGNDTMTGTAGDDRLFGLAGNDTLNGGTGNDTLRADAGNDTLDGGAGDDQMTGGEGNDIYKFGLGSGNDNIREEDRTAGNVDAIQLGAGLTVADITLSREWNGLVLTITSSGERLYIEEYFSNDPDHEGDNYVVYDRKVEEIRFADGTVLNETKILQMLNSTGTDNSETLTGTNGNDTLNGGAGDDQLFALAGMDTINGGSGNDYMEGRSGNDTYLYGRGSGWDTIFDNDNTFGNIDTVKLTDLRQDDISVSRGGNTLSITIKSTGEVLTLQEFFATSDNQGRGGIEKFEFGDGTILTADQLVQLASVTTSGNDSVIGSAKNDVIDAMAGDDTVFGGEGNDTIKGGLGNDNLQGGAGNDTYLYAKGDGHDYIYDNNNSETGSIDTLKFTNLFQNDVTFSREYTTLYVTVKATGEVITIDQYFNDIWGNGEGRIEQIQFADFTTLNTTAIQQILMAGTTGNDFMVGTSGDDTLTGQTGNDWMSGKIGSDTYVYASGDGSDTIYDADRAQSGTDTLQLSNLNSGDVVLTRDSTTLFVRVVATGEVISIAGQFGDLDTNSGEGRIEQIQFADGTVWDSAGIAQQLYQVTDGNDFLIGTSGNDVLNGLGGDDYLAGLDGNDTMDGGAGNDTMEGLNGNDTLYGGAGGDALHGGFGDDTLVGGTENDSLHGYEGSDTYVYSSGDGSDYIWDADGSAARLTSIDTLKFTDLNAADVTVTRNQYQAFITINATGETITLENQFKDVYSWADADAGRIEKILFANGTTWDAATLAAKANSATEGNNFLVGTDNNDIIYAFGGDDSIYGMAGNDTLYGGAGNDGLVGGIGNDTLNGEAGNDSLTGEAGDDTLKGGLGDDGLYGNDGSDTYVYASGDGNDYIWDNDGSATRLLSVDTLKFTNLNAADITVSRNGWQAFVTVNATGETITLEHQFNDLYSWGDPAAGRIEKFLFADGTSWDAATIAAKANTGTEGNNLLVGTAGNDTLSALGGDDSLYGLAGNDSLDGGAGADYLAGGAGNDSLTGGSDNDTMYGEEGDDTLTGGTGSDYLSGAAGNDTYLFASGDGNDTILDGDVTAGNSDTLRFTNLNQADVSFSRDLSSLFVTDTKSGNIITVQNFFTEATAGEGIIENFVFADGSTLTSDEVTTQLVTPDDGNDFLVGTEYMDTIEAFGGNDVVRAQAGDDTVFGGAGDDVLYGGEGDDALVGNDGDDTVFGENGNDLLFGGAGVDILNGGYGDDIYFYNRGDGNDIVVDDTSAGYYWNYPNGGGNDTLRLGLTQDEVTFNRSGNDLQITVNDTQEVLTLQAHYATNYWTGASGQIENIVFSDGTTRSGYEIDQLLIHPTSGDDVLYGTPIGDTINALAGNDTVYGYGGDDVISGGVGNDALYGADGNDTYIFNRGAGQDVINDNDLTAGNIDTLRFGADILASDITVTHDFNSVWLTVTSTGDSVQLANHLSDQAYSIENIVFGDGTTWGVAELLAAVQSGPATLNADVLIGGYGADVISALGGDDVVYGMSGDDTIYGGAGNDLIKGGLGRDSLNGGTGNDTIESGTGGGALYGNEGNDRLLGGGDCLLDGGAGDDIINGDSGYAGYYGSWSATYGNDLIIGGTGNDQLYGGYGNDTYEFNRGFGNDLIHESGVFTFYQDLVRFTDISSSDIAMTRDSHSLYISVSNPDGTSDSLTIQNEFYSGSWWDYSVEQIQFADGVTWSYQQLASLTTTTTDGNDFLVGTAADETISGLEGDDTLYGGAGIDTINGDAGNDTIYGGAGDDTLNGGTGSNTVYGNEGNDTLQGGGSDTLMGGAGDDTITATSGVGCVLDGGAGNDRVNISGGNDTILFGHGDGVDTIGGGGWSWNDTIRFKEGVTVDEVTLLRPDNGTLTLQVANPDGTVDSITKLGMFGSYYGYGNIENVAFADGTVWSHHDIELRTMGAVTDGNDTIFGTSWSDVLDAGAGNDVIEGNYGNDTLIAGAGNDRLLGGQDSDTYDFTQAGFGQDTIYDHAYFAEWTNDVMKYGVNPLDIIFSSETVLVNDSWNRQDLMVTINGSTDGVRIEDWFGTGNQIETTVAGDGRTLASTNVNAMITAMATYCTNNGFDSWSDALATDQAGVQTVISQYWLQP